MRSGPSSGLPYRGVRELRDKGHCVRADTGACRARRTRRAWDALNALHSRASGRPRRSRGTATTGVSCGTDDALVARRARHTLCAGRSGRSFGKVAEHINDDIRGILRLDRERSMRLIDRGDAGIGDCLSADEIHPARIRAVLRQQIEEA